MTTALDVALVTALRAWVNDAVAQALAKIPTPPPTTKLVRGSWVWDYVTGGVGNDTWESAVLAACSATGFTDLYCFSFAGSVADSLISPKMAAFNARASAAGIRVWGLEGDRAYFSDGQGPAQLYNTITALDVFNTAFPNGKFYGLVIDMEPPDQPSLTKFHNGIASPALTAVQAADREAIMEDWCTIHQTCQSKLHAIGMKFGSCLPSWCYDYFGSPVTCTFNNVTQNIWLHLLPLVDSAVILSYSTNPNGIAAKVTTEMNSGSFIGKVSFAVETVAGVGAGVSYGDTPSKQSKAKVLADLTTVEKQYAASANYAGWNIHSMQGWEALPL